jgi:putative exosortase-associated protein (TIGR04073 family)
MKTLLSLVALSLLGATAFADIQDPPANDQGPTRKLARGFANMLFAPAEFFDRTSQINFYEGNSTMATYGIFQGIGRFWLRIGAGIWETISFPFATNRGTYKAPYRSNIPWIHGGLDEFPPEIGFETHYRYGREYSSGW